MNAQMEKDRSGGIEVHINGESRRLPGAISLRELVESLGCDPQAVAVERNGALVRRAEFAATEVAEGDRFEVVRFVQGG